jgi:hypothetical protein
MSEWQPIDTLDLSTDQFVLLHENGAVRLLYWDAQMKRWTYPDPPFAVYEGIVRNPEHWMGLPTFPERTGAEP